MTPTPPRNNRRKLLHGSLGMTTEAAVVLGCILSAIAIVCWAA
jgi:hypothetical protein